MNPELKAMIAAARAASAAQAENESKRERLAQRARLDAYKSGTTAAGAAAVGQQEQGNRAGSTITTPSPQLPPAHPKPGASGR